MHHLPPFRESEIRNRLADIHAGVVDQDLDLADLLSNRLLELPHLGLIGHVSREDVGHGAELAHGGGRFVQQFEIARGQHHARASFCQGEGDSLAKAFAGTGD